MTGDVIIREATPDDLPACAQIINDYIDGTEWLPRTVPANDLAALFSPKMLKQRYFLVAEQAGAIGGYLSMDEQSGFVAGLYLAEGSRCNGTGKALLDRAKAHASSGISLTVFEPNVHAKRFYMREGFAEIPEERKPHTPEGVPTLMLRWGG